MDIIKFNNFIKEAIQIPVVDMVIDLEGNVYNGVNNPIIKGNVNFETVNDLKTPTYILGDDKKRYIAGIDKNGKLVAGYKNIVDNYLVNDNRERIKIPENVSQQLKSKSKYWSTLDNYVNLISLTPTGWVNTKVDMEIIKRVRRYSSNIGLKRGDSHKIFMSKLEELHSINELTHRKRNIKNIQREMSLIMLLHYIDEIKGFFEPSSTGFLFESFMAGLMKNAMVNSDNGRADVISEGKEYQVKCLTGGGSPSTEMVLKPVEVNGVTELKYLDHYILCFKFPDRVEVFVIDGDPTSPNYCDKFKTGDTIKTTSSGKSSKNVSYSKLTTRGMKPYIFDILSIDDKIDIISKGLKDTLGSLYNQLSIFQYNVETIISGVDHEGKIIEGDDFTVYSNHARENATSMKNELENLISHYKREPKV